ncbi:MAG: NUDIX hydrolase [Desulfobacterales bacterium]|nr:NUDIX hydrolase [Desulfobacterales bacterium]MBF0398079.1 NUDIX hydrolase [Desulfobacterales bacterium]
MKKKDFCNFCGNKFIEKFLEGKKRLFCETCNDPLYENPVPATCTVLIDEEERVLLVKRNVEPKKGYWCLPGGFMEIGEMPEQGALRELEEETGLDGQIELLLGVTADNSERYGTVLMLGYLVKKYSGALSPSDDASEAVYFSEGDLPEIAFSSHQKMIRLYYAIYGEKQKNI